MFLPVNIFSLILKNKLATTGISFVSDVEVGSDFSVKHLEQKLLLAEFSNLQDNFGQLLKYKMAATSVSMTVIEQFCTF